MDEVLMMRAWLSGAAVAATLVGFCADARATTPVVVEYTAPPECASSEAFHALLSAQLAQTSNPDRPWRFSVSIRHESDYVGVLRTETGSRELRAPTCDEVTAALSLVIAMAQPELPAPPPPIEQAPPPPPPMMIAPVAYAPPPRVEHDVVRAPEQKEKSIGWRLGARIEHWDDGSQLAFEGAFLTVAAEIPWGFPKMHFELGVGAAYSSRVIAIDWMGTGNGGGTIAPMAVLLGLIDTQACPIDLPLGSTGIDVMGCARLSFGLTKGLLSNGDFGGGAWGGGGARLRWQSPWHLFVDAQFSGLYGTPVNGIPAVMDFGGSVGFRI
jgi:hypothetical protein